MAGAELHRAAEELLRARLEALGIGFEPLPDLPLGYAMLLPGGQMRVVKVVPRAAPHRRGGRGSLGLHWVLPSDFEEYAALVDLSRETVWLMPSAEFRSRAQPLSGGRWHLDWLVLRLGRSKVADEAEFERYRLERMLEIGGWKLEGARPISNFQPPTS